MVVIFRAIYMALVILGYFLPSLYKRRQLLLGIIQGSQGTLLGLLLLGSISMKIEHLALLATLCQS